MCFTWPDLMVVRIKSNDTQKCKFKMQIQYMAQFCFSAEKGNSDSHLHKNQSQAYNKSLRSCTYIFKIHTSGFKLYEQLTAWSRITHERLVIPQLDKTFPEFYGTWGFITIFTRFKSWILEVLKSFVATDSNEMFSGRQPRQMWRFSNTARTASVPTFRVMLVAW